MSIILIIIIGFIAALIGALPVGLVNLTVLDKAFHADQKNALHVAHGAAWIEVVFGFIALSLGNKITVFMDNKSVFYYVILLLPALVGIVFLFRKNTINKKQERSGNHFLKGVFLNLISVQVLLYWLIAVVYISHFHIRIQGFYETVGFLAGIWIGKMLVLWFYAKISKTIFNKWQFLSLYMNRIIGGVLLVSVFIQFFK